MPKGHGKAWNLVCELGIELDQPADRSNRLNFDPDSGKQIAHCGTQMEGPTEEVDQLLLGPFYAFDRNSKVCGDRTV